MNAINRIKTLIETEGKPLVSSRPTLETRFPKKAIDFSFQPVAHFRIKHGKRIIILVHKKPTDKAEAIVGEVAIGYEGEI